MENVIGSRSGFVDCAQIFIFLAGAGFIADLAQDRSSRRQAEGGGKRPETEAKVAKLMSGYEN